MLGAFDIMLPLGFMFPTIHGNHGMSVYKKL